MLDECLISVGGGLLGGGLGTTFLSAHGSKLEVIKWSVCRTMVGIPVGETDVTDPVQEDVMCDGKEPWKLWGRRAVAATIMEFWTMKGCVV